MEVIEAVNKTAGVVLDIRTGTVQSAVLIRGFEFRKALMQEHFNENYLESHKFPRAEFKGTLVNNAQIDYAKKGEYTTTVKGQLTIHGVTKEIEAPLKLEIGEDKIDATTLFSILLSDYKISIPAIVKDNISNNVNITVDVKLTPLKQ